MLSTSILSRPRGPNELLTMLAIDCAVMTVYKINERYEIETEHRSHCTILVTDILSGDPISSKKCTSPRISLEHRELG